MSDRNFPDKGRPKKIPANLTPTIEIILDNKRTSSPQETTLNLIKRNHSDPNSEYIVLDHEIKKSPPPFEKVPEKPKQGIEVKRAEKKAEKPSDKSALQKNYNNDQWLQEFDSYLDQMLKPKKPKQNKSGI